MSNSPDWDALKRIHDHFATHAATFVHSGAEVNPQLFLLRSDDSGKVVNMGFLDPETMHHFFRDEAGKEAFAEFLKLIFTHDSEVRLAFSQAQGFEPNLAVQVNEAWAVVPSERSQADDSGTVDGLRPSKHPDRRECLLVTVHTRLFSVPVMHAIEDKPARHVVPGVWPEEALVALYRGRFAMQEMLGPEQGSRH